MSRLLYRLSYTAVSAGPGAASSRVRPAASPLDGGLVAAVGFEPTTFGL